jgi:hypothetical protein
MSELLLFIWAVVEQWVALVTGGVLAAIIMALEHYWQKTLAWLRYKWVLAFSLY